MFNWAPFEKGTFTARIFAANLESDHACFPNSELMVMIYASNLLKVKLLDNLFICRELYISNEAMTLDVMVLLNSVNWSERSDPDHSDLEFKFCALVPARYFRWRHSLDSLETWYVFVADSISYWPPFITAFMEFIRILRQNADRLTAAAEKFFFICVKSIYCQLSVCVRCSASCIFISKWPGLYPAS